MRIIKIHFFKNNRAKDSKKSSIKFDELILIHSDDDMECDLPDEIKYHQE